MRLFVLLLSVLIHGNVLAQVGENADKTANDQELAKLRQAQQRLGIRLDSIQGILEDLGIVEPPVFLGLKLSERPLLEGTGEELAGEGGDPRIALILYREAFRYQFIYSMTVLVLSILCMLGGFILSMRGIAGSVSWILSLPGGTESKLMRATPGVVLIVIGLLTLIATRFQVEVG